MNLKNYLLFWFLFSVVTLSKAVEDSTAVNLFPKMENYKGVFPSSPYRLPTTFQERNNKEITEEKVDFAGLESALEDTFNGTKKMTFSPPPPPPADDVSNGSVGGLLDDEIALIQKARETIAKIQDIGSFVTKLGGETLQSFPVGISQEFENTKVTLAVAGMKVFPGYSQLEVFLQVESPRLQEPLTFFSPDIKFTVEGGIVGGGSLGLLGDIPIDIRKGKTVLVLKRGLTNELGQFTAGTYAQIGCDGFEQFGLDAEVHFSRDWIRPVPPPPSNNPVQDSINMANDSTRVVGRFTTIVGGLDDILIEIDMDDFVAKGVEDVVWKVDTVIFDFSEERNSENLIWPIVIADSIEYEPAISNELWVGFYMKDIEVSLPSRLTGTKEVRIGGENIVIDAQGFTGKAYAAATPLIGPDEGNADGWSFSVNYFEVAFVTSDLKQIYFDGGIDLPMFRRAAAQAGDTLSADEDALAYEANINLGNEYSFSVSPNANMKANCWQAYAIFHESTRLDLRYNGSFTAKATIYADIGIDGKMGKNSEIKIPEMTVEGMVLSNKSPYFQPGNWSMPDSTNLIDATMGSFSLTVTAPQIWSDNSGDKPLANIDFGVSVGLDGELAIEAGGDFTIVGELDTSGDRHKWRPKKFKINELSVEASFPGVDSLSGKIYFFDEENFTANDTLEFTPSAGSVNYGSGFRGTLFVQFKGIDAQVEAVAQFGEITEGGTPYRYFMVDVLATFSPGIQIGAVNIVGLGGGVYRHMRRPAIDKAFAEFVEGDKNQIGASLSGVIYEPDPTISLGIKLSVVLQIAPPDGGGAGGSPQQGGEIDTGSSSFNANLSFGIEFGPTDCGGGGNSECLGGFGIVRIWFQGNGRFMAPTDLQQIPTTPVATVTLPGVGTAAITMDGADFNSPEANQPANDASVSAHIMMDLNFREKIYDGLAKIVLQVPGNDPDKPIVDGVSWSAIHLDKNNGDWWIHIGTPDNRNSINIDIGIATAQFTSYFMMGNTGIPDVPPPFSPNTNFDPDDPDSNDDIASRVTSTLAADMGFVYEGARNAAAYDTGEGLIFGAGFHFSSGFKFLFLHADIGGGVGFDVGIKQIAGDCIAAGDIGFNGWYAKGQAWAYFFAAIKAKIKLGPFKKTVDIFEANAAALVQLEGPNPIYARAQIVGKINILGLVKGDLKFKFEIGEKLSDHMASLNIPEDCINESGGVLADIVIIESLELPEGVTDSLGLVSTSVQPEIELNFANFEEITVYAEGDGEDDFGRNETYQFRTEYEFLVNGEPMTFDADGYSSFGQGYYVNWNEDNTEGQINFLQYLPQNSEIKIIAKASIWGVSPSDIQGIVLDDLDNPYYEVKELVFETGGNPQFIDPGMVKYSYPYEGQQYMLKDETDKGAIALEGSLDMSYLLEVPNSEIVIEFFDKETNELIGSDANWEMTQGTTPVNVSADSLDADGNTVFYTQSINSPHQRFDFTIPKDELGLEKEYYFQMVRYVQPGDQERTVLYEVNFKTSQFGLLADKLATFEQVTEAYISTDATANNDKLTVTLEGAEPFDSIEWTPSFDHPDLHFEAWIPIYNGNNTHDIGWYETEAKMMYENVYGQPSNWFTSFYYQFPHLERAVDVFPNFTEPTKIHLHYRVPDVIFDDYMSILGEIQVWDSLFAASPWADMAGGQDSIEILNQLVCQQLFGNLNYNDCITYGVNAYSLMAVYVRDSLGIPIEDDDFLPTLDSIELVFANQVSGILIAQQSEGIASLCDLANFGQTLGHQYFGWEATPGTEDAATNNPGGGGNSGNGGGGPNIPEEPWFERDLAEDFSPSSLLYIPGDDADESPIPNYGDWAGMEDLYNKLPQWIIDLSCNGGGNYIGDLYGLGEQSLSGSGKYQIKTRYRIPTTNDIYNLDLEIEKSNPAAVAGGGGSTVPGSSTPAGSSGPSSN